MSCERDYSPVHDCPVCGAIVYNVFPFLDDCNTCQSWAGAVVVDFEPSPLCGGAL